MDCEAGPRFIGLDSGQSRDAGPLPAAVVAAALREAKKLSEKEWPAFNLRPKSMRYVALLLPILCLMVSQVLRTSSVNNAQSSIRLKIFLASSR
jgi:hypothetical protein